ncbi:hypothetical protein JOF46_004240 [Paeniglutamicibacter psychrophenolicus]|uniref:Uncharacterized protein n=1 Tax=Paeniglutamicibacter psychrophenolicus TaxID=257454 RepID=A0ABS4WK37_9MICC|nr:hypothetical protein [Paeniglutamicibacter psychrophenolicus]
MEDEYRRVLPLAGNPEFLPRRIRRPTPKEEP